MPTYCANSTEVTADRYELNAIGTQVIATFWRNSEKVASIGLTGDWTIQEQSVTAPVSRPYSRCTTCDKSLTFKEVFISSEGVTPRKDYCSTACYTWIDRLNAAVDAAERAQEGQDSPVIRTLDELMAEAETNGYGEIHHPFYARAAAAAGETL